ncbi:protein dispatched homolog 1-like isoform X2 [Homarus americanus]|uniref:Dispatched 1-like n=1 Tax=Homarus americanus TaxID=6706 RepID=A0A8J5N6V1_HOMAM|nr:protein dispatched homolog 1-like isoform X2 [Homarus americanus]KAG7174801.1 dispatched 1-like [Homarus americanus]
MIWYARLLCHHPYAVLSSVVVVVVTCLVLSLTARPLPAFTDPSLGFESRGTVISQRAVAWENLLDASRPSGPLGVNPLSDPNFKDRLNSGNDGEKETDGDDKPPVHTHKVCIEMTPNGPVQVFDNCSSSTGQNASDVRELEETPIFALKVLVDMAERNDERGENPSEYNLENEWDQEHKIHNHENEHDDQLHNHDHIGEDGFFCNPVVPEYGHMVIKSTVPRDSLLTLKYLQAICQLDDRLRSPAEFKPICETWSPGRCCPSWTLPNYVAFLSNRTSCHHIKLEDVINVHRLLRRCARYLDLQLEGGCHGHIGCRRVPQVCLQHDAVYTILHYLVDAAFLNPEVPDPDHPQPFKHSEPHHKHQKQKLQQRLSLTAVFVPVARSSDALPYFEALQKLDLTVDNVTVAAMDLGLKYTLFDKLLMSNSFLLGVGGGVVVLLMWCYTGSLFITVVTITTVACALVIAYFMYIFIYEITFFPYMNILTTVIAIGIGADDTFVYCRVWTLAKQDKNSGTMVKLVADALHHAAASIIVTSLTTAAAFFASCVSHITAIRCFSIFAGTVVLANLMLMLTWVPACVVVAERWGASTCCLCVPPVPVYAPHLPPRCSVVCALPLRFCYFCTESAKVFFEKMLPWVIVKPRYLWILLLGSVAAYSAVVVFYFPGLKLPDSQEFQLFSRDHVFEQYDLEYKYKFWFERNLRSDIVNRLPVRIVWGIKPVDNGDYLNPASKGTLEFDDNFDVAQPESQEWLLNFCRDLRNQTFYMSTLGPLLPHCFIETFKAWMNRRCIDPVTGVNREPCCETSEFPFSEDVFNHCIHKGIKKLYETPREYFTPGVAGPKFSRKTGKILAVVVEYDSNILWSLSYDDMQVFFNQVDTWVRDQMKEAPKGMKGGWFTSYLSFFDVQKSLSVGTGIAVAVAVGVSLAVLVVTTLNVVVSLLAVLSVGAVILVTLAALVLLGWHLNVLESVTVSVAIGLAVDLTLHYGVAYRLSPEAEREAAVSWAVARLGSPVFMAAATSLAAGIAMLPAKVLAYVHIGTFLTVITMASYIYATLFYLPLLRIFGPESGCGQLSYPQLQCCTCCSQGPQPHVDKTVYQQAFMSESTLSTSSTSCPAPQTHPLSDTHELEPLTAMRLAGRGGTHSRAVHNPTRHKVGLVEPPPISDIPNNHVAAHNEAGIVSGTGRATRSGSLSSSVYVRDHATFVPRKVSLPSPGGAVSEGGEPSPRHSVAPASSATTILYSEPDTDSGQQTQQPPEGNITQAVLTPENGTLVI